MSSQDATTLPLPLTSPSQHGQGEDVPDAGCVTVGIVAPALNGSGPFLIVARRGIWQRPQQSWRAEPQRWQEIGLLGGDGRIRRVSTTLPVWQELLRHEPLACGHSLQVSINNHND